MSSQKIPPDLERSIRRADRLLFARAIAGLLAFAAWVAQPSIRSRIVDSWQKTQDERARCQFPVDAHPGKSYLDFPECLPPKPKAVR